MFWSLSSVDLLLRLAEIAYEQNDGHLEIFENVVKVSCKIDIKDLVYFGCAETLLSLLRHDWTHDGHFENILITSEF